MTVDEIVQKIYEERYQDPKHPEIATYMRDVMIREVVQRALELAAEHDSAFGETTRQAVYAFQQLSNLPPEGTRSRDSAARRPVARPEFRECSTCAAKPGTPLLCGACLYNRSTISQLAKQLDEVVQTKDLYDVCAWAFGMTRDDAKERLLGAMHGAMHRDKRAEEIR